MQSSKRRYLMMIMALAVMAGICTLSISQYVQQVGKKYIVPAGEAPTADAILILGARVFANGDVSLVLRDRLTVGLELYKQKKAAKIIVSGDHGQVDYDEVNTMKDFLIARGVPAEDIFMDHAGFSTYESMYRARDIFQVKKIILVTQKYHLMRALFIAREMGLDAYGVTSDEHLYSGFRLRSEIREIAARNKDFFTARFIHPLPTYLGDTIPISGDGRQTDDQVTEDLD